MKLKTPYQLYEAEVKEDLARAVADVGRQQSFPIDYFEQLPRAEYSGIFIIMAACCCVVLIGASGLSLRTWS